MKNKRELLLRRRMILLGLGNLILILILLGLISNHIAIRTNNGKMPVKWYFEKEWKESKYHMQYQDIKEINNWFLTDIFGIGYFRFSIGDVLIVGGYLSYLYLQIQFIRSYK